MREGDKEWETEKEKKGKQTTRERAKRSAQQIAWLSVSQCVSIISH